MTRPAIVMRAAGAIASALAFALIPASALAQTGSTAEALVIELEVTDRGYNCLAGCEALGPVEGWAFTLEVDQGQLIDLTFVWNHPGYPDEEHIMVLKPYKLEWARISNESRRAQLQFIADQPGGFTFECDLDCELHDYIQFGKLKVGRGGGAGGVANYTPTSVKVTPSTWATAGENVTLMAVLQDENGVPVPKAEIRFALKTEYTGVPAQMDLGAAQTDANGVAFFDFRPTVAGPSQVVTAIFAGVGLLDASEQSVDIIQAGPPKPAYQVNAGSLAGLRRQGPVWLGVGVAAVWLVLAYVVFQTAGVAWTDRSGRAEGKGDGPLT